MFFGVFGAKPRPVWVSALFLGCFLLGCVNKRDKAQGIHAPVDALDAFSGLVWLLSN